MAYFDGGLHGWNGSRGYIPPAPQTLLYCDDCAPAAIPLPKAGDVIPHPYQPGETRTVREGAEHHGTGFRWAPRYGGGKCCDACGKPVDNAPRRVN